MEKRELEIMGIIIDPRDAKIAQLERELAEARERLAAAVVFRAPNNERAGIVEIQRADRGWIVKSLTTWEGLRNGEWDAKRAAIFPTASDAFAALALATAKPKEPGNGTL